LLSALASLVLLGCGEPTMLPPFGDSGGGDECGDALARWDDAHPLPPAELSVVLHPGLLTGPAGVAPDPGADGDRATRGTGAVGDEIVLELTEPLDVRGVRHYPPAAGDAISHYEVFAGDDTGCDESVGDVVVALGPFYEDAMLTPRVASSVRIAVRDTHEGSREYAVADFQLLVGADFESVPESTAQVDVPWTWDSQPRIPGVGPLSFMLTTQPPGMEIDASGVVTWTAHISQVGEHMVNIFAARGEASIERRFILTVNP